MDSFWTVARAGDAVGVECPDGRAIARIWTDTRTVAPGDLFVALKGEQFDAHDFIQDALARGAAALVVSDGSRAVGVGIPVLVVHDTLVALGALARYHRVAWSRPVIAVGGSNGKTTTKELIRSALSATFGVHATSGNLNNRIGAPMTLLSLPESADLAVIEVGTNEPGEIATLRDIVQPDIAVITTVQAEHLEGFGSLEGVLAEEMTLCDGVQLAIVPAAESAVVDLARARAKNVVTAGLDSGDVRPDSWGIEPNGHGWLQFGDVRISVPVPGAHNVANAVLAVAVARACGVTDADAARGLTTVTMPPMRSAIVQVGRALLVNDAYNANPASMKAALALLDVVAAGRPKVAVLGTMREMGAHADALHDEVARAVSRDVAVIGAVGDFAAAFARVAPGDSRVVPAADPDALWPLLEPRLAADSAILLKGSRGVRLERLVPLIEGWAAE